MIPFVVVAGLFLWALKDKSSSSSSSSSDQAVPIDDPMSSEDEDTVTGDPADDVSMYNVIRVLQTSDSRVKARYTVTYGKPTGGLKAKGFPTLSAAIAGAIPPQPLSDSTMWIIASYWASDAKEANSYPVQSDGSGSGLAANAEAYDDPTETGGRSAKMEKVEAPVEEAPAPAPAPAKEATVEVQEVEVQEVEISSAVDQNNLFNGGVTETRVLGTNLKPSRFGGGY